MINKIIAGDCSTILREHIPNEVIDLTITSPPYDDVRDYNGKWSLDLSGIGKELFRVTKDGGIVALVINDGTKNFGKSLTTFRTAIDWCDNTGFKLFETIIYSRQGRPGAWWSKRFRVDHEYILLFLKGRKPKYFNKEHLKMPAKHAGKVVSGTQRLTSGELIPMRDIEIKDMKGRGTIWHYAASNTEGNKLKMQHPATFPDQLVEDLILCFSDENNIVLDPLCGSGTTCVVAKKLNRRFIGIDTSREYCNIAKERIRIEANDN